MSKLATYWVPFDFSEASRRGLEYAMDFAGPRKGVHLRICFISEKETDSALQEAFDTLKSPLGKGFRAQLSWTRISPPTVEGLLEASREGQPDLVIIGTSGSDDPEGTTKTSKLVLAAPYPVLVVPSHAEREFRLKKIALVLGPREIDDPNDLATLLAVARTYNAQVTVLTIENRPVTYGYSEEEERNERLLEYYLESFYSHHAYIRNEDVVQGIFEYVDQHEIDMIAIFPRNHSRTENTSEGRLTRILALQSSTPLLAIES
jgi:nucleotide-binding universal stress UspA family protein